MTDDDATTDPTDELDELDDATIDELRSLLRVPHATADPDGDSEGDERREVGIAAALAAYDEAIAESTDDPPDEAPDAGPDDAGHDDVAVETVTAPVISLDARRRGRARWLTAAAAALVLVVGVGVAVQVSGGADESNDTAGRAEAMQKSADDAADQASEEGLASGSAADGTDSTTAAAATAPPQAATDLFASPAGPVAGDLGSFDDTDALASSVRDAVTVARSTAGPATDPATPGAEDPPTTLESIVGDDGSTVCAGQVAALGTPRYTAIVDGRPVIVAPAASGDDGVDIVRLDDCTTAVAGR